MSTITLNRFFSNLQNIFDNTNAANTTYTFNYDGSVPDNACANKTNLVTVNLKINGINAIGINSFTNCTSLRTINIPSSLQTIGDNAFASCSSLTDLDFSLTGVDTFGSTAFAGAGLTTVILPDALQVMGYGVFTGCSVLTSLDFSNTFVSTFPSQSFSSSGLTSIVFPPNLITIDGSAFDGCAGLTSLNFPSTLTTIGNNAFVGCNGLTNLVFPASLTNLGPFAFFNCGGLTSSDFSKTSVTLFDNRAFGNCINLASFAFPNTLTSIGDSTFDNCPGLTSVNLSNTGLTTIFQGAFNNCINLANVIINNTVTSIDATSFSGCTKLRTNSTPYQGTIYTDAVSGDVVYDYFQPANGFYVNFSSAPVTFSYFSILIRDSITLTQLFNGYIQVLPNPTNPTPGSGTVYGFYDFNRPLSQHSWTNVLLSPAAASNPTADSIFNTNTLLFSSNGTNFRSNLIQTTYGLQTNAVNIQSNSPNTLYYDGDGALSSTIDLASISDPTCFNEGTKILCLNKEGDEEYIAIEKLCKGDLVKTYLHGYRRIDIIGKNILPNDPSKPLSCMFKMEKTDTNGLIEDLIITGGHSILVDTIENEECREKNNTLFNNYVHTIDNKVLLLAAASDHFKPILETSIFVYYHFILENDGDDEKRYGVWANGVLVETPSKKNFTDFKLLES